MPLETTKRSVARTSAGCACRLYVWSVRSFSSPLNTTLPYQEDEISEVETQKGLPKEPRPQRCIIRPTGV